MELRTGFIHDDVNIHYNQPMLEGTRQQNTLSYVTQSSGRYSLIPTEKASNDSLEARIEATYNR